VAQQQCEQEAVVPDDAFLWDVEPIRVALDEAGARRAGARQGTNYRACTEVGRRMLLAQFRFSSWVLRRVEKVRFASDRRIARSSSIELRVPDEAPVVTGADGEPHWLIPLTVMRRRTLVNLDLRNEDDEGISLLGLRFTQKLDEAMLRAAARLARPGAVDHTEIDRFVHVVVTGTWQEVQQQLDVYDDWRRHRGAVADGSRPYAPYFANTTFRAALERMWHNFTLYVMLPVSRGRHRTLRLAFEERVEWRYQSPDLRREENRPGRRQVWNYRPIAKRHRAWSGPLHYFGLRSTRIRFLTPSAENCASYHFEFFAPTGLWVTSAAFVGGRPNVDATGETPWDSVRSPGHSVGLHAVEVPNGSLCRAQVHLRVPSRGWLSTLTVSCWAAVLALLTVAWHAQLYGTEGQWTTDQVTNIVLLLVTVCAGGSTYVAQHPAGDVAARMLTGPRLGGALVLTLPAVAAVFLVYLGESESDVHVPGWMPGVVDRVLPDTITRHNLVGGLLVLSGIGAVLALLVLVAWVSSIIDERRSGANSPWDMTTVDEDVPTGRERAPIDGSTLGFHQLVERLELGKRAVGVYSAEGWHERYGWDDERQKDALRLLGATGDNPTGCACREARSHRA
jgi:hypothetical protein